jgi:hypothetical protein
MRRADDGSYYFLQVQPAGQWLSSRAASGCRSARPSPTACGRARAQAPGAVAGRERRDRVAGDSPTGEARAGQVRDASVQDAPAEVLAETRLDVARQAGPRLVPAPCPRLHRGGGCSSAYVDLTRGVSGGDLPRPQPHRAPERGGQVAVAVGDLNADSRLPRAALRPALGGGLRSPSVSAVRKGVTQRVYDGWRAGNGLRSVRLIRTTRCARSETGYWLHLRRSTQPARPRVGHGGQHGESAASRCACRLPSAARGRRSVTQGRLRNGPHLDKAPRTERALRTTTASRWRGRTSGSS